MRVSYTPQSITPAAGRGYDAPWDWSPTIDVLMPKAGFARPIGFRPWPKEPETPKAKPQRRGRLRRGW